MVLLPEILVIIVTNQPRVSECRRAFDPTFPCPSLHRRKGRSSGRSSDLENERESRARPTRPHGLLTKHKMSVVTPGLSPSQPAGNPERPSDNLRLLSSEGRSDEETRLQ